MTVRPPEDKRKKPPAAKKVYAFFAAGGLPYRISVVLAAPAGQGAYSPNRSRAISASRWAEPSMPNWLELSIRWQLTYSSPPP